MSMITWSEGAIPPIYPVGLPTEIHFWKNSADDRVYILAHQPDEPPSWFRWNSGVAIKNVGTEAML